MRVRAGLAGHAAARGCRAPARGAIVHGRHVEMRGMGQGGALCAQPPLHVRRATCCAVRRPALTPRVVPLCRQGRNMSARVRLV